MGPLGWQETIFIFVFALLIFGPKKLPELGKTIGKAMTEFRRASSELKSTWDREMSAMERENESLREVASSVNKELSTSIDDPYGSSYYDSGYEYGYDSGSTDPASTDSPTVGASATEGAELTAPAGEPAATSEDEAVSTAQAADSNEVTVATTPRNGVPAGGTGSD